MYYTQKKQGDGGNLFANGKLIFCSFCFKKTCNLLNKFLKILETDGECSSKRIETYADGRQVIFGFFFFV